MNYKEHYQDEFQLAVEKTEGSGYTISESLEWLSNGFIYPAKMTQRLLVPFTNRFGKRNGCYDLSAIKGHCFEVHNMMHHDLSILLKLPSVLTMGYVTKDRRDIFKFENIESLPKQTTIEGKPSLNYHIWLTLPNYKILDFTFIAHYAYTNYPEYKRHLLTNASDFIFAYGNADTIYKKEDIIYHPLYVGYDVIVNGIGLKH